ncbi:unnamed protein product [Strongylus vulgaris]|uniref:Uncharacterized protein n=1 Tax=Strongylus vulgaris TaxID=40348 RepID=A0A3P7LBG6_STRVU|nr:unnamed protein product [Strongylus vulgaris]
MGIAKRYNSCGDRPQSHQPKVVFTGRLTGINPQQQIGSFPPSKVRFSLREGEKSYMTAVGEVQTICEPSRRSQ